MNLPRGVVVLMLVSLVATAICAQDLTWSGPEWVVADDAPESLPVPKSLPPTEVPAGLAAYEAPLYAEYRVTVLAKGEALHGPHLTPSPYLEGIGWRPYRFEPAKRGGKFAESEIVLHLIFNPKSAGSKLKDATPRLLRVVPPIYPTSLTEKPSARIVLMEADVDATGAVTAARAIDEAAPAPFATAASHALARWKFAPARRDGAPVPASVRVPVGFLPSADEDVGELSAPPRATRQVPPVYPLGMRIANLNGEVMVAFVVTVEGRVRDAYIARSSHPAFDEPAVEAVEQWRFEPGVVDGRPVNTRMQVPIVFRIQPGGQEAFVLKRPKSFPPELPPAFHFDHPPELIGLALPVYPIEALRAKKSGKVSVRFVVGPTGQVQGARAVIEEKTDPALAAAAVAAVEAFRFKPPSKGGLPCYAMAAFEVPFQRSGQGMAPVTPETDRILRLLNQSPEKLVNLGELDAPPRPRGRNAPVVPSAFRDQPTRGEALIEFVIDRKGFARLPRIVKATDPAFGYAAMQAISTWRFDPPRREGRIVDAIVSIPVVFDAKDREN